MMSIKPKYICDHCNQEIMSPGIPEFWVEITVSGHYGYTGKVHLCKECTPTIKAYKCVADLVEKALKDITVLGCTLDELGPSHDPRT